MFLVSCQLSVVSRKFVVRTTDYRPRTDSARRGLSLTEVLISMGILTVGLLGVASVFPVASFYMLKADNSDISSSLGQSAMNELVTRGMLDPWSWFVITPSGQNTTIIGNPNYQFSGIDGNYAPHPGTSTPLPNSYTRPFAEALSAGQQVLRGSATVKQTDIPVILAKQFGNAFCIDPMGIAAVQLNQGQNASGRLLYGFPSASFMAYPGPGGVYYSTSTWNPWRASGVSAPKAPSEMTWPIRRVTFRQSSTGWNLDKKAAEHYFQLQDDLSYDFPARDDRPSAQSYDLGASKNPLARQWKGDYSWIATVVPSTNEARDLMPSSPNSVVCDVSVVVLYKRTLPSDNLPFDYTEAAMPERSVSASIVSTGLNGGELLLKDMYDGASLNAFTNLKSGQWIMLCGPHPNSTASAPRFSLNWYQVISIESDKSTVITDPTKQRVVSVRGPEWPWQPSPNGLADYAHLSNDLCVGIIKGAIAVHTKTIALQDSQRTGVASFGAIGQPPQTNNKNNPH